MAAVTAPRLPGRHDRPALVTGRAIAEALAADGAAVHVIDAVAPEQPTADINWHIADIRDADAVAESVLGALAEPADIADAVLFLLSSAARRITGQILQVDSGQYI